MNNARVFWIGGATEFLVLIYAILGIAMSLRHHLTLVFTTSKVMIIRLKYRCSRKTRYIINLNSHNYTILDSETDRPLDGCPLGTNGCGNVACPNTCFCEDHCSWKKCKLDKPPNSCLKHTRRTWVYDRQKGYWRTKFIGNLNIFLEHYNLSK